jgi:DNA-binding transcriptional LysR family regulator
MNVTLRQLKVFEAVARHLSFTRAAEELFLTQPAVSMQVKQLEQTVGMQLLEQVGKKLYMTEAGKIMYQCAIDVGDRLDDASEKIAQLQGFQRGTLKISVATTASYFVINMLKQFSEMYPQININLDVTNRSSLLEQLTHNERDITIMGEPPDSLDLISRPFMDNPLIVIASPDDPLLKKKKITLEQLASMTFVTRESGSGTRAAIERFFEKEGVSLQSAIEMSSNEAIKQAVQAGLGLAIVSSHTVELELATGRLAEISCPLFPIMRKWYLVHPAGKIHSPIARLFDSFVLDYTGNTNHEQNA